MFNKILISNRGEIACRIARTARQMGIQTVAVYSEADANSLHVSLADEAVCIGPAPAGQSYLAIESVVEACLDTEAEAVHPGFGFLSENAAFVERLVNAGVVFIGPQADTLRAMGDKIEAKRLALESGLDVVPGHPDTVSHADQAVSIAGEIGYPVILKASAGGGGKGMRVVHSDAQCQDEFQRAAREAQASFGDDRLFIEKLLDGPRHIEVQIVADRLGNTIHLGERECSLQRRHQKVVEESPSPFLDDPTRAAMVAKALSLAKTVNYESAGTVEFLVDREGSFFFLEMNTRLQVEHPVTELVTGIDLVELMIRIAAGEPLPLTQNDVAFQGWAIESRIYAEDPARGFLPSTGRLTQYLPPHTSDSIRIDSGVCEGSEVSMHYDPMLAKLVAHGTTREEAITKTQRALDEFCIRGVSHNINFLSSVISNPRFQRGDLDTDMIATEYPTGFDPSEADYPTRRLVAIVAAVVHYRYRQRAAQISDQSSGYATNIPSRWITLFREERYPVTVLASENTNHVQLDNDEFCVQSSWRPGEPIFRGSVNGQEVCVQVERIGLRYCLVHRGTQAEIAVVSARTAELLDCMPPRTLPSSSRQLVSPMPGRLSEVAVLAGDKVRAGQTLAVVEAMKMQNILRAASDGLIDEILASEGDTLAVDQPILRFAEEV
jgi:propionyl-CoA carboxylase alpha chain